MRDVKKLQLRCGICGKTVELSEKKPCLILMTFEDGEDHKRYTVLVCDRPECVEHQMTCPCMKPVESLIVQVSDAIGGPIVKVPAYGL